MHVGFTEVVLAGPARGKLHVAPERRCSREGWAAHACTGDRSVAPHRRRRRGPDRTCYVRSKSGVKPRPRARRGRRL
jgi:hypothetical protein